MTALGDPKHGVGHGLAPNPRNSGCRRASKANKYSRSLPVQPTQTGITNTGRLRLGHARQASYGSEDVLCVER